MCESVCIVVTFTVFYYKFSFYSFCLSVCLSLCVCVSAMLPDSNKMMMMMIMYTSLRNVLRLAYVKNLSALLLYRVAQ